MKMYCIALQFFPFNELPKAFSVPLVTMRQTFPRKQPESKCFIDASADCKLETDKNPEVNKSVFFQNAIQVHAIQKHKMRQKR